MGTIAKGKDPSGIGLPNWPTELAYRSMEAADFVGGYDDTPWHDSTGIPKDADDHATLGNVAVRLGVWVAPSILADHLANLVNLGERDSDPRPGDEVIAASEKADSAITQGFGRRVNSGSSRAQNTEMRTRFR